MERVEFPFPLTNPEIGKTFVIDGPYVPDLKATLLDFVGKLVARVFCQHGVRLNRKHSVSRQKVNVVSRPQLSPHQRPYPGPPTHRPELGYFFVATPLS